MATAAVYGALHSGKRIVTGPVRFADDVSLHVLEDEGVVFCEGTQELYALNATGAYIWCCLEDGMTPAQAAASLAGTFRMAADKSEDYVRDMVARWAELGFLATSPRPISSSHSPSESEDALGGAALSLPAALPPVHSERLYRVLTQQFRVRFTSAEQEDRVHPLFAHLEAPGPAGDAKNVDIVPDGKGYLFAVDSRDVYRCASLDRLAPHQQQNSLLNQSHGRTLI